MPHEQGAWALRFVPNGAVCVCDGGRPTSRGLSPAGRQCRQPEPSAPCRRAHAPRAGGMGASFRSEWGGLCMRRRQAHEQGPAACGGWGEGKRNGRRTHSAVHPPSKKNYPASAVRRCFFTRRSGRAETCGRLLPSPGDQRSGAWHPRKPTRNPFLNLWVKAQAWRTPQDNHWEHYSRRACRCQRGTGRFSTNCKT